MNEALRWYFVAFYAVGIAVLLLRVLPDAARATPERAATGLRRLMPWVLLPLDFLLPPLLILFRVGELRADAPLLRGLGFFVSLYAAGVGLWAAGTMGRLLVPQAIVSPDHRLVTEGPFRFLRHPAYSGDLALWLGAALGTVNLYLMVLFPLIAAAVSAQARVEDELLEARFGDAYRLYAARVGRLLPRLSR
jgi:protein-S-isoprenylcysteine O-methyltransferase Ste14